AEGVTMGTRFVAPFESPVHLNYKQAIVAAPITGTALTDNPPRARSRGLRTPYAVEVAEGKRERLPRNATRDMRYVSGAPAHPPAPHPLWHRRRRPHPGRPRRKRRPDPRDQVGAPDHRRHDRKLLARD